MLLVFSLAAGIASQVLQTQVIHYKYSNECIQRYNGPMILCTHLTSSGRMEAVGSSMMAAVAYSVHSSNKSFLAWRVCLILSHFASKLIREFSKFLRNEAWFTAFCSWSCNSVVIIHRDKVWSQSMRKCELNMQQWSCITSLTVLSCTFSCCSRCDIVPTMASRSIRA